MAQSSFVERTLEDINRALEQSVFAEKVSHQKGLLQAFDPRAKLISILLFLFAVGFADKLWEIAALFLLTLLLAAASKIHLLNFIKRMLLVVLLFTGLIALPALFMTPGPVWVRILPQLAITSTGATTAAFLLMRVSTSVSLASLLILTTPWNDVLKALGILHLPDVIVLILGMTYRYIHLLLHEANDMFMSRKSRILRQLSKSEEHELLGATGGVLLSKSLQLSGEVYLAMQSRGYHHYPHTLTDFKLRWWDSLLVIFSMSALTATLLIK